MKKTIILSLIAIFVFCIASYGAYQTKVYFSAGGDQMTVASGGEIEIESSGVIDVESGGEINIDSGGAIDVNSGGKITFGTIDVEPATGGVSFGGGLVTNILRKVELVTESDTLTASQSGLLSIYRPLAAKALTELPTAAAGLWFEFLVADADSLNIYAANGDSLITSAGAAYKTETSVAGTMRIVAIDTTRWVMTQTLGTWTGY